MGVQSVCKGGHRSRFELTSGAGIAHPSHRLAQEVGGTPNSVGPALAQGTSTRPRCRRPRPATGDSPACRYSRIRGTFLRRRRPLAGIAILVLEAASGRPARSVSARGISNKGGSLIVSLPRERNDFLAIGDSFAAANVHTMENVGTVEVISVESDFCLCQIIDRMESADFWAGLENRMAHDFSPPAGVEFSRHIDKDSIDSIKRLIRSWGV